MDSHSHSNIISQNSKSQYSYQVQNDPAKRFHIINKQERQDERQRAHKKDVEKRKRQQRKREKFLLHQIDKKRQELLELEQEKDRGTLEVVSQAEYRAKVHMENHRIKKMEKNLQNQIFQRDVRARAQQALKWQEQQKRKINYKQHQAEYFRKTICKSEKKERNQAIRMAKSMVHRQQNEKQMKKEQEKRQMDRYVKGLNRHGVHKKPPTNTSSPHIIICKQNQQENQAMKNAGQIKIKANNKTKEDEQKKERNRQKAIERGQAALDKIKRQRQYQNYCQQVEQDQIVYNKKRIAAGKKNQYTGVKPMTLSQIQLNKKLRGQEEFQKTFFKGKKTPNSQQLAAKYTIFENKMKETTVVEKQRKPKKKEAINYADQESRYNNVSEGRYSFEQERQWQKPEPQSNISSQQQPQPQEHEPVPINVREYHNQPQNYPRPIMKQPSPAATKNQMKETRAPGASHPHQLNYSQSEQQQSIHQP